jgi:hypothetical protein
MNRSLLSSLPVNSMIQLRSIEESDEMVLKRLMLLLTGFSIKIEKKTKSAGAGRDWQ